MPELFRVVSPRSRAEIEHVAADVRFVLGIGDTDHVDMARLLDLALPDLIDDYEFRVADNDRMGEAEALTDLNRPIITMANTTYEALCRGEWRARMTAAHELGHLMMHSQRPTYLAKLRKHDPLIDPERQADIFAAAFLMPDEAFRRVSSIEEAMEVFGVSRDAACYKARRLGLYRKLVFKAGPRPTKKKGGKHMARTP